MSWYSLVVPLRPNVNCGAATNLTLQQIITPDAEHPYRLVQQQQQSFSSSSSFVVEIGRFHSIPAALQWKLEPSLMTAQGTTAEDLHSRCRSSLLRHLQRALGDADPASLTFSLTVPVTHVQWDVEDTVTRFLTSSSIPDDVGNVVHTVADVLSNNAGGADDGGEDTPTMTALTTSRIILGRVADGTGMYTAQQLTKFLRSRPVITVTRCDELWLMQLNSSGQAIRLLTIPVGVPPISFAKPKLQLARVKSVTATVYQELALPRALDRLERWIGERRRSRNPQLPVSRGAWMRALEQFAKVRLAVDIDFFLERLKSSNVVTESTIKEPKGTIEIYATGLSTGKYRYIRKKPGGRAIPAGAKKMVYPAYVDAPAYEIKAGALSKAPSSNQLKEATAAITEDPAAGALLALKLKVHVWLKATLMSWRATADKTAKHPIRKLPQQKFRAMLQDVCTVPMQVRPQDLLDALLAKQILVEDAKGIRCVSSLR